jgi:hypothetical protein
MPSHRQLVAYVEYERVRQDRTIAKDRTMNTRPEDVSSGALFKNDRKEKPSHPDYRGDATIHGRKFGLAHGSKMARTGKYMSLAIRHADDEFADTKPKPTAKAVANAEMPF